MSDDAPEACACSLLLAKQLASWAANVPILVEELIRECPPGTPDTRCLRELIRNEIVLRQADGQDPCRAEYLARFPTDTPTLDDLFLLETEPELPEVEGYPEEYTGERRAVADGFGDNSEHEGIVQWVPDNDEPLLAPRPPLTDALPDFAVPGYEFVRCLGHGGLSSAYLVRDTRLNRDAVIKLLRADQQTVDLQRVLCQEAQAMAALLHPNIVQVHQLGDQDGRAYIVMEYLAGGSLADFLAARSEPLPLRAIVELMETVALALGFVHRRGFVHHDMKPGNLLLTGPFDGRTLAERTFGTVKIADFGLSIATTAERERSSACGRFLGTPRYMAPEQAEDHGVQVGPTADVYSVGVTLYELLTGRVPFCGETMFETLWQMAHAEPPAIWTVRPDVPAALESLCRRCLSRHPAERYANGDELAEALRAVLQAMDEPAGTSPAGRWWRRFLGQSNPG